MGKFVLVWYCPRLLLIRRVTIAQATDPLTSSSTFLSSGLLPAPFRTALKMKRDWSDICLLKMAEPGRVRNRDAATGVRRRNLEGRQAQFAAASAVEPKLRGSPACATLGGMYPIDNLSGSFLPHFMRAMSHSETRCMRIAVEILWVWTLFLCLRDISIRLGSKMPNTRTGKWLTAILG